MTTPSDLPIAVASRSFSSNPTLRSELLERYGNVRFNDAGVRLVGDELIAFCRGRRKLIVGLETIDDAFLAALPELEVVSKYGVGTDKIDLAVLRTRSVRLGWSGGVNTRSVAELTIAFMISLLRHLASASDELRRGTWRNRIGRDLTGRAVGLIGCGNVGKDVVRLLAPFDCVVLAHDLLDFPEFYREHRVRAVSLDELLTSSDIVSLHVPLTDLTARMLDEERLSLMRPGACLVNTARGGLVDEEAVKALLMDGRLGGAAFDVFATEPPDDPELFSLPNFLGTPHIGGSSEEAVLAMGRAAIQGLDDNDIPSDDWPPVG